MWGQPPWNTRCPLEAVSNVSVPAGSQRYVVMRTTETQQLKDHGHRAVSNPAFGKTVRDLPL